jgi:hypothetical protein
MAATVPPLEELEPLELPLDEPELDEEDGPPELLEPELPEEPGGGAVPESPPEPGPPLEPEPALFWSAMVPVSVGLVLWGSSVALPPEMQYEYTSPTTVEAGFPVIPTALPEIAYVPVVAGMMVTNPIAPVCWMSPTQLQPPFAASVHVREE